LGLFGNAVGPAGARALAAWPGLAGLKWAQVGHNPLGPDAVELRLRLACRDDPQGEPARTFRLDLDHVSVGDEGVARPVGRPELARCQSLELMDNGITSRGARLLAGCPSLRRLERLELGNNPLDDEGAVAIAGS